MGKLFEGLKKGLEEALAFSERKLMLKSELIEIPESTNNIRLSILEESERKIIICKESLQKH
ncbi:hypothetical protein [Neochlamydia sp. S13]|uniref:hypothetical protein n=1 Tax=Neochlamydia sp. S13 TaxID=1353976 RepID=UPI0005A64447|nr:hypothetical protein [Neochlamydia sp. S13]BBI17055.1 Putative uncharacterized protein [Neochlamydia sp. S13]